MCSISRYLATCTSLLDTCPNSAFVRVTFTELYTFYLKNEIDGKVPLGSLVDLIAVLGITKDEVGGLFEAAEFVFFVNGCITFSLEVL